MVKNLSANAGDMGSIPGPGRFHMPWDNQVWESQLLKPKCSRVHTLQQEKPLQWEVQAPQLGSSPCLPQLEKDHMQQWRLKTAKNKQILFLKKRREMQFEKRSSKIISSYKHLFVLCNLLLTITSGTTSHFLQKVNFKESEAVKFWVNFSELCVSTSFPISNLVSFVHYFSSLFCPSSPPSFILSFFSSFLDNCFYLM